MEDIKITLDKNFLERFYKVADSKLEENEEISLIGLKNLLDVIEEQKRKYEILKKKVVDAKEAIKTPANQNKGETVNTKRKKTIFIIDDLGVITYQLETLFRSAGFDTVTSNEVFNAISKFKRIQCDFVLMDLFIPTEREGLILLEKIKKLINSSQRTIKIGIITASTKKEHKQICKIKGADFYFEKLDNWHENVLAVAKETLLAQ